MCKVSLIDEQQVKSHKNGSRHAKNLRMAEYEKSREAGAGEKGESPYVSINPENSRRMCNLCNVEFTSLEMEDKHMNGTRHQNNVRSKSTGGRVIKNRVKASLGGCKICDVIYTSVIMKDSHINGKKHTSKCRLRGLPVHGRPQKRPVGEVTSDAPPAVTVATAAPARTAQNVVSLSEPPKKRVRLETVAGKREPIAPQLPSYQVLEKQVEEAYRNYAETATRDPTRGAVLYGKYQSLYKAYEASYEKYVRMANVTAVPVIR